MTDKLIQKVHKHLKFNEEQKSFYDKWLEEMTYTPLWPDWFYSYFEVPNIELIRNEIRNLIKNPDKNAYATNISYFNIDVGDVYKHCPLLKEYFTSVGLEKKFCRILVSRNVILNDIPKAHVDSYDPYISSHSINIGIDDYEDSYTAWFKTDKPKLIDAMRDNFNPIKNYAWLPLSQVTEIKRVKWDSRVMLVNTTILHKGVSDKKSRLIAGLRFYPELTQGDILRLGIKNPHVQED